MPCLVRHANHQEHDSGELVTNLGHDAQAHEAHRSAFDSIPMSTSSRRWGRKGRTARSFARRGSRGRRSLWSAWSTGYSRSAISTITWCGPTSFGFTSAMRSSLRTVEWTSEPPTGSRAAGGRVHVGQQRVHHTARRRRSRCAGVTPHGQAGWKIGWFSPIDTKVWSPSGSTWTTSAHRSRRHMSTLCNNRRHDRPFTVGP
jgi:hypothetical protein